MNTYERSASQQSAPAEGAHHSDPDDGRYGQAMQRYIRAIAGGPHHSQVTAAAEGGPSRSETAPESGPWGATLVGDVMTRNVIVVDEDASFKHVAETLAHNRVSALPVVDVSGRVLGVVSESDLLAKVAAGGELKAKLGSGRSERRNLQRKAHGETAAGLMSSPAITALPTDDVVDAARVAAQAHIRRLPVVDASERVVGIVTRSDLLRAFLNDDATIEKYVTDVVLTQQFLLSPTSITADVHDGVVTLRGRLDSEQVLCPLTEALRGVAGVVAVHSELVFDEAYPFPPPVEY
jgi:CBS-domain-containing membrane protein